MLDYCADGMSMWDTWYLVHEGTAHMYYLQNLAKESGRNPADATWLGHAVSQDLIHWTERPLAVGPDPTNPLDDLQPWTGCVAADHRGQFYFYFTMRASAENGKGQRIGLALSQDLDHWTRYEKNPVILPDPRYYISYENPLPNHTVDCRDLIVIPDPAGHGWLGFFAARIPGNEQPETAVVAVARSQDLIHWEQLPPAFAPRKYATLEVPDVYFLDGRWYMTCLVGNRYGNRGLFSDSSLLYGTIYAVADRPEGPYQEIEGDNVLIGSQNYNGYSCRSLMMGDERYVLYTQPAPKTPETVSPPMRVRALADGRLRLSYSDRVQGWRQRTLIEPGTAHEITCLPYTQFYWAMHAGTWVLTEGRYRGESHTGWQTADLEVGAQNLEFEATIVLQRGVAAGLIIRPDKNIPFAGDDFVGAFVFLLDAEAHCVMAARLPTFDNERRQKFPVEHGVPYHVRVCIRPPRFEVFIDDVLALQSALDWPPMTDPSVGLFVDRGVTEIYDLALYELG